MNLKINNKMKLNKKGKQLLRILCNNKKYKIKMFHIKINQI